MYNEIKEKKNPRRKKNIVTNDPSKVGDCLKKWNKASYQKKEADKNITKGGWVFYMYPYGL